MKEGKNLHFHEREVNSFPANAVVGFNCFLMSSADAEEANFEPPSHFHLEFSAVLSDVQSFAAIASTSSSSTFPSDQRRAVTIV